MVTSRSDNSGHRFWVFRREISRKKIVHIINQRFVEPMKFIEIVYLCRPILEGRRVASKDRWQLINLRLEQLPIILKLAELGMWIQPKSL